MKIPWFQIRRSGNRATVSIFGEIIGDEKELSEFERELEGVQAIELFVDSCGGNSSSGVKLNELLTGRCVEATVTNRCFSAAVTILMAATKIRILPKARIMIHSAAIGCFGNAEDLRIAADGLEPMNEIHAALISKRTGLPIETVRGWNRGDDHYFSAEQSLALGLVDEIIPRPETPAEVEPVADTAGDEAATPTEQESLFMDFLRAFGRVQVADKEKFGRELSAWLACVVTESICG